MCIGNGSSISRDYMALEYDRFSAYYADLIKGTGHLEKECKLIDEVFKILKIRKDQAILDVACGTGDALLHLARQGYENLTGSDISCGMLSMAKRKVPFLPLICSSWKNLPENIQNNENKFDLVYLLSISILHASLNDISIVMHNFYNLIAPGGKLVFDIRKWQRDQAGVLRQRERPEGVERKLAAVNYGSIETVIISDICTYSKDRQIIQYKIVNSESNEVIDSINFDYALCTSSEIIEIANHVGFKTSILQGFDWPYFIIVSHKVNE